MAKTMIDCKIIKEQNNGVERKFQNSIQKITLKFKKKYENTGKTTLRTLKSHIEFIRFFLKLDSNPSFN